MGGPVRGRLLIWGDAMCLRARIRSFKPPQLHFLPFYHNLEVDKDCLVTQFCLFCIVTSLKILASYTLLPLLMYSCKFQLRNSIFIILYTITCALNDQSCRCAIKQHSFIHSFIMDLIRPELSELSAPEFENWSYLTLFTLASANIDQSVSNLATIYIPIKSQMSSIMGQIESEHLELFALEFGKIAESDLV